MATKYDQSSATRPVSIRSHTSAFQVHFKHTSSALEMSSVNPPIIFVLSGMPSIASSKVTKTTILLQRKEGPWKRDIEKTKGTNSIL